MHFFRIEADDRIEGGACNVFSLNSTLCSDDVMVQVHTAVVSKSSPILLFLLNRTFVLKTNQTSYLIKGIPSVLSKTVLKLK